MSEHQLPEKWWCNSLYTYILVCVHNCVLCVCVSVFFYKGLFIHILQYQYIYSYTVVYKLCQCILGLSILNLIIDSDIMI